jgi:hypothetical protein
MFSSGKKFSQKCSRQGKFQPKMLPSGKISAKNAPVRENFSQKCSRQGKILPKIARSKKF